jgi:hypothetical protein
MNNEIYIYHQTCIGDHILCFPIIKHYAKIHDKVYVLAYNRGIMHIDNLKILYSSLSNVELILFNSGDHAGCLSFLSSHPNNLIIGHEDYRQMLQKDSNTRFDKYFYERANVPFENKWGGIDLNRNKDQEKNTYLNVFNLKEDEDFIFVQEDPTRNYYIKNQYVNNSVKAIESAKFLNVSIFNFLYTIEKAKEVHVINSSFLTLIDMLGLREDHLFYHKYVRSSEFEQPHLKLNWKIIE